MRLVKHTGCLTQIVIFSILFGCAGLPVADKTDGALLSLKEAVKKAPQNTGTRLELARLYAARYQETKKMYFLDAGIKEALEAVRLKPTFSDAHLFLSRALFLKPSSSLDERIIDELKQIQAEALKQDPDFIRVEHFVPYQYFSAFVYYNKASKEKKYLDMVAKELKEAIQLKPDLHGGHCFLGRVHFLQGKEDLALFEAKEAVRLDPDCYLSHELLGGLCMKKVYTEEDCYNDEMIELGIKEFKEAIRLDPEAYYPHSMLGYLYRSKGLHDLSIFELKQALRLSRSAGGHEQLGITFERKGEFDEAIKEYFEALVADPKFRAIYLDLAWTYFLQNRFSDSISEINRYLGPPGGGEQPFSTHMRWDRMKRTGREYLPMDITLCLYFSMRQKGDIGSSLQMLGDYEKIFKGKKWEFRLVQYLLGKASEAEVIAETKNRCDHALVFFFIAYDYFAKGNNRKAVEYFQKTLNTNVLGYRAYAWAEIMLKRLKQ